MCKVLGLGGSPPRTLCPDNELPIERKVCVHERHEANAACPQCMTRTVEARSEATPNQEETWIGERAV